MIASLSGTIIAKQNDSIILDVHGVGFEVSIPKALLADLVVGHTQTLHTQLVVREDLLALYGFESFEQKQLFLMFLEVNGVGPRLALSLISNVSPDTIRRAIINEQPELFARVPGIGRKTAQKILIQLQGKFAGDFSGEGLHRSSVVEDEVLEALVKLGYSVVEAQTALQSIPRDTPDTVEEKLRTVLQYFDR